LVNTWIICDNHIAIKRDQEILHPSAADVYEILYTEGESIMDGMVCPKIQDIFPNIFFSKIGSDIKCTLRTINDNKDIQLEVFALRGGKQITIDIVEGVIIDQCINGDEWFYITGDTVEISSLLKKAKISSSGVISISQYVEIIRMGSTLNSASINNYVETSIINKPIDINSSLPYGLQAKLYAYQKTGYLWMKYMLNENHGCILGDEMGLGKTLQVISVMQDLKQKDITPMLIIAPVSLLQNWQRECQRFAPKLQTLIHHGSKRTGRYKTFQKYDAIIISYNTAVSDSSILSMVDWKLVVLDEAQNIKNPNSERTKYIKKIPRKTCIAMTGTPFENHVSDIWSLVDFIMPGLYGTLSDYKSTFTDDVEGATKIEPLLSPIMIRRRVCNVATDLPEKIIIPQPITMSEEECMKYEEYRLQSVGEVNPDKLNLGALQKLRMFCTHPFLCDVKFGDPYKESIKYQRLCEILEEIVALNEKVILFTSYIKMFEIIEKDISNRIAIPIWKINGSTRVEERQVIVDTFCEYEGSALLVLNPRAAGTGLNITAANHVIHYNLEWNPALEDQASARAYRRGQNKVVFVYRLYYENTVEQIVNDRIERKRKMADNAIVGVSGEMENREDILTALKITPIIKEEI
jgi:SNF2 family DNA or RNA helicase